MEEALIALLLGTGPVEAIVDDRIWPTWRPQGSPTPSVTLTVISRSPQYHASGASGLDQYRIQLDVFAESYGEAKALSRAVVAALSGFSGVIDGVRLGPVFLLGERDMPEMEPPDRLYRVSLDFDLWAGSAV